MSKGVSSVVSILEGRWWRSIRTVSHPATKKFRHGCRLSCCDCHGLPISTVNPGDEPSWEEKLAQPSFACVLLQACVFHPPRFSLTSTRARWFLHPFGRTTALQLRGSSSCVDHFLRSGAVTAVHTIVCGVAPHTTPISLSDWSVLWCTMGRDCAKEKKKTKWSLLIGLYYG